MYNHSDILNGGCVIKGGGIVFSIVGGQRDNKGKTELDFFSLDREGSYMYLRTFHIIPPNRASASSLDLIIGYLSTFCNVVRVKYEAQRKLYQ